MEGQLLCNERCKLTPLAAVAGFPESGPETRMGALYMQHEGLAESLAAGGGADGLTQRRPSGL